MASTSDSRGNPVNPSDGERVRYVPRGSMSNSDQAAATGLKMENIGHIVIRYGVVIAVAWIGALKYTNYEEKGIEVLLVNSPLISWAYHLIGLRTLCAVIGTSELVIAALLAVRYFAPKASMLGGIGAIGMFLTTLSFLFTTPGALMPQGFPFLSGDVGEFLIKDIALLGAAIWMTGDSLRAAYSKSEN
jgi:reactive chlorine resistance protein C